MNNRKLVIYHYFEKDSIYAENLKHFLLFGYRTNLDFLVVISGECSVQLPKQNNIVYLTVENRNGDFGGIGAALSSGINTDQYDYFIFINSSVRGPYLLDPFEDWTDRFTSYLSGDVGISGCSINILPPAVSQGRVYQETYGGGGPYSHIQTMAYALTRAALKTLLEKYFFDRTESLSKKELIQEYEIRLSQSLIDAGFNLKCFLPEYNSIDYRAHHVDPNPTSNRGDPVCPGAYFGRTVHPYEVLFIKTNRELYSNQYLRKLSHRAFSIYEQKNAQIPYELLGYVQDLTRSVSSLELSSGLPIKKRKLSFWRRLRISRTG